MSILMKNDLTQLLKASFEALNPSEQKRLKLLLNIQKCENERQSTQGWNFNII